LLTRHSLAREFSRSQISKDPFANEVAPLSEEFKRFQQGAFADWRLIVDGMVARPASFSQVELKSFPRRSHITMIQCEEGWSYVAEWTGVPLSHVLELVGALPQVRYVVYRSIQPDWWESIDMADAPHPQTLLTYEMNGGELSRRIRRTTSHARFPPTRIQEREIPQSPDSDGQPQTVRQGSGRR